MDYEILLIMDKRKKIVIVAHKFNPHPDDDLVLYLNLCEFEDVLHICHSFPDAPDRCSFYAWYKNGSVFKQIRTRDYRSWNEVFLYGKEFFFTFLWIWKSGIKWDAYIGMDGLCVCWGNILRRLRFVRKTIFWAIDFVPNNRFPSRVKNWIYAKINNASYSHVDEMWDLSPRMIEAREEYLNIKKSDYHYHRVVPYGVWTKRIKKYSYEECEKNTLVFMGHLLPKQGVQLVLQSMPQILFAFPDFRFKIIGTGSYKQSLMGLANDLGICIHCDFMGKIEDNRDLEKEIAKSCVAIAPYSKELDNWTYYADPGKIKTYLACGVPVIMTDIPWNTQEIVEHQCGLVLKENEDDVVEKITWLFNPIHNQIYRNHAIDYAERFDYETIFRKLIF